MPSSADATPVALTLFAGSDSFGTLWPDLAREFDFAIDQIGDLGVWLPRRTGLRILSVAGREDEFIAALTTMAPAERPPFMAVGADPSHRTAVAFVKAGASDYLALPGDLGLLRSWLDERRQVFRTEAARTSFVGREAEKYRFEGMVGTSETLRAALDVASRVIPHPSISVVINGETGTGKELLARAIHCNGPRREAPFVDINCAAIPENLLESELFGHEKGAFTGATSAKPGLFEMAHGGTIFLDEIGHLPFVLQGKLLRALDQRVIRRVGGMHPVAIDVRVIAATHVDLPAAVQRGEFRDDLYHRLNVLPILLPPLRARGGDVLILTHHFLERFATAYGITRPILAPGAIERIRGHAWSGNIRELRNVIERAVILCRGGQIEAGDLSLATTADSRPTHGVPFPATMQEITRSAAKAMLERCGGNKSSAARCLDISRTRLLRLLDPHSKVHLEDFQ